MTTVQHIDMLNFRPWYVGPYHRGMGRPRVADGRDGLEIWKVAMNIAINQSELVLPHGGWARG